MGNIDECTRMNLAPVLAPAKHRQHWLRFIVLDFCFQIAFEKVTGILRQRGLDQSSNVSAVSKLVPSKRIRKFCRVLSMACAAEIRTAFDSCNVCQFPVSFETPAIKRQSFNLATFFKF